MSAAALDRRTTLRNVASETKSILPEILSKILNLDTTVSSIHHSKYLGKLNPKDCPGYVLGIDDPEAGQKGTRIRVYDQDSFDTALEIQPGTTVSTLASSLQSVTDNSTLLPGNTALNHTSLKPITTDPASTDESATTLKPVAVLNLASEKHAGGGWQRGALAQEEALCYRSSLYLSLHHRYYPIPPQSALYSPSVILIRENMPAGHNLLYPNTPATDLPVFAVITMAALRRPKLNEGVFAYEDDVLLTKEKIRIVLRIAALKGHGKLVLGAMGCGAFGNPPREVAQFFLDVLQEEEFQGGWWEDLVFAVLDNAKGDFAGKDGTGNFGIFYRALHGVVV
ncbi:hypothetical protein B0J11DRAFT_422464 [Dendryphion nanum]|uniref:Microbial-type PARG catalytic domain-containing protein n=1 Tax=Dendryphion nanum TaxID=256645 RepID=A0A9P9EI56_9PLEO|nr:hypothetical protein B0J11DRAFT_422464 [Dendryphion nanum]